MLLSYCITCHKRLWQVVQTLDHNLKYTVKDTIDICLLLYNDEESFKYLQTNYRKFINDGRLKLYNFKEEPKIFQDGTSWSCGYTKNLIHMKAKGEVLFNLDADNFIDNNLQKRLLVLKENELIITSRREWLPDGRSGRIGVHSKLYKDVQYRDKGRNDDGDFINRCVRKGCKVIEISCPLKPISNSITN
jgi:hypothetical protein